MNQNYQIEETPSQIQSTKLWFAFIIVFIIIDYGRPQELIKIFAIIRPALLTTIILAFLVRNFGLINFKITQLRLIWFFIFLLTALVPFAVNHGIAFKTVTNFLIIMPFIHSCCACINTIDRFKRLMNTSIFLMAYQAIWAILHSGRGSAGIFFDENDLALYINAWLPFCFAMVLASKGLFKRIFFGTLTLIGVGAIVMTFSRGGFLGLIAMFAVFWLFSPKKLVTLGIAIIGVVVVMYVASLSSSGKIKHQKKGSFFTEMDFSSQADNGTGKERIESWKSGWNMFKANPFGVGANNYPVRFPEYQTDYFKRSMWGRVAHSLWFTLIPETGIIGIIIYLSLIAVNVRDIFKIKKYSKLLDDENGPYVRSMSVAFLASLAGFFTSATFLAVLYYPHFWYLSGYIVALKLITEDMVYTADREQIDNNGEALYVS